MNHWIPRPLPRLASFAWLVGLVAMTALPARALAELEPDLAPAQILATPPAEPDLQSPLPEDSQAQPASRPDPSQVPILLDPGRAELQFFGELSLKVEGKGVHCTSWGKPGASLDVFSSDLAGPGSTPHWTLAVAEFEGLVKGYLRLGTEGEDRFTWKQTSPGVGFKVFPERAELDLQFVSDDGNRKLQVTGTAWCPVSPPPGAVPQKLARLLETVTGSPVRPYSTFDFGRAREPGCISVLVPEDRALQLLKSLRAKLDSGWIAFIGTGNWLGEEQHPDQVELVIGPGRTQFDILRLARTNALNYGMGSEALVKKLAQLDEQVSLEIWQAETDLVRFDLRTQLKDPKAFAEDLARFSPDTVDTLAGSLEALQQDILKTRTVTLWWD